jgi:hypothetical protein
VEVENSYSLAVAKSNQFCVVAEWPDKIECFRGDEGRRRDSPDFAWVGDVKRCEAHASLLLDIEKGIALTVRVQEKGCARALCLFRQVTGTQNNQFTRSRMDFAVRRNCEKECCEC